MNSLLLLLLPVLFLTLSAIAVITRESQSFHSSEWNFPGSALIKVYAQLISIDPVIFWLSISAGSIFIFLSAGIIFYYQYVLLVSVFFQLNYLLALFLYLVCLFLTLLLFDVLFKIMYTYPAVNNSGFIYYPLLLVYIIFYPLARVIVFIDSITLRFISGRESDLSDSYYNPSRKYDILLSESKPENTKIHNQEIMMLQNALVFSKTRVRECMIPRTEVEAVEINTGVAEAEQKFISTGYSKLIVYDENMDNISGYINSKDIFKNPVSISEMLLQIPFVPETMPANRLLHEFMHEHRSVAVVVDEYGGTSGIVTLEDIMEEIFGDIEDEHDTDDLIEKKVRNNEYVFSGRLEIEYLNSKYTLNIPESEEYDTLAGYILFHFHNLPKNKQVIETENFIFTILKGTNTRIELVLLKVKI